MFFTNPVETLAESAFPESVDPSGTEIDDPTRENLDALTGLLLDLNKATQAELTELPGVSQSDAALIIDWRNRNGSYVSTSQASSVAGLSPPAIDAVKKYASVAARGPPDDWNIGATFASAWNSSRLDQTHPILRLPDFAAALNARWSGSFRAAAGLLIRPGASAVHAATVGPGTGLVAGGPAMSVDPAAFAFTWEGRGVRVTAGTFQVGFATGLTMDTTGLRRPRGHYEYGGFQVAADSGNLRRSRRFSGGAVTFNVPAGQRGFTVSGTAFASYSFLDQGRGDISYDRCPRDNPRCPSSEQVPFVTWDDSTDAAPAYLSLTDIVRECTAGGNLGIGSGLWRVEASGWATGLRFRPDAPGISASRSSPMPEDRRIFGAAGLAGTVVIPSAGIISAEAAITDAGATAAVAEAIFTPLAGLDIEPSFRYYARGWDNPWTGSTADTAEFRGNRARDEIGARVDLTWRSSRFTRNRIRIDAARHGPDDTEESSAAVNLDAIAGLQVFASAHENISVEIGYRDRDLTVAGRSLSWDPYYSEAAGNISGGCRIDWTLAFRTTRIPRTTLALHVSQAVRDSATLERAFEIDMAATARLEANLNPGPKLSAFFRWSDESLTGDHTVTTRQACSWGAVSAFQPGSCRGDARLDVGLGFDQEIKFKGFAIRIALDGRYTRHIDDRASWASAAGATGRNDFVAIALAGFGYTRRQADHNR